MTNFFYELKIPKERIAVLIGKSGETKKKIEEITGTKLDVNSQEGDVSVSGEDAISLYNTRELIKAIGRGFNPDIAQLLLKGDYIFDNINLNDVVKTKNELLRLKGRVIGKDGKSRRLIEELTESFISVYGKTIGMIGESQNVSICRRAVESLLRGSTHASVYKWLEKQRKELKKRELLGREMGI
jgi:ribosomal RNA assembly protein